MRFTREIIFQDTAVQRTNATKWGKMQESYNEALYDNYKMWAEYVWSQWVRYKNKTVKRKQATSEKKKDKGKCHILESPLTQAPATSDSLTTREVPPTNTPPVPEQETLALTPPRHRTPTNHLSGTPSLSTPLRNLRIGYTTPSSSSAIESRRPLKRTMDDADDAYDAIPQPDAKRRMLEPSIAELLLYHLRHGHIHPSVVMQCVAEVQSEKGELSDMEPSLGENSLSAPSRVTTSHDQEILLSSPGQEVVTHSDGNLMEEIIHHPVPIYPRYQRISICSNLTNIEVSMNTPQSPKHGLSWSNESLELPIMPAQIVTTIQ